MFNSSVRVKGGGYIMKIILILTVLIALFCLILFTFFSIYKYKSRDLATYIFTTWPLQLYVYIVRI